MNDLQLTLHLLLPFPFYTKTNASHCKVARQTSGMLAEKTRSDASHTEIKTTRL